MNPPQQFVRLNTFIKLMGWSRSTYYNRVASGLLPAARSNGPNTRTRGYWSSEVVTIQQSLVTGPTYTDTRMK